MWDAAIIGGGLAGSSSAIELARAGRRVVLLEKEAGPHDKVCGEFISSEAQRDLAALGVDLQTLGAVPIDRVQLSRQTDNVVTALPFTAMSLSRRRLDAALLEIAHDAGADVRRGITVTGVTGQNGAWEIATRDGDMLHSRALLLATGKHDLRGYARPAVAAHGAHDLIGFKMYFRLNAAARESLQATVALFLFANGYAGLEPVEDGIANLCLVVTKTRFAQCGKNWETLLASLAAECPALRQAMTDAAPLWPKPLGVFGIPYGYVHDSKRQEKDFYRLGDQMAVIPSFCGDGMAIALHTGRLAARHVIEEDAVAYHRTARRVLQPQIRRAMRLSRIVRFPAGQWLVLHVVRLLPALLRMAVRRTRVRA